jgi:hypothetical protein
MYYRVTVLQQGDPAGEVTLSRHWRPERAWAAAREAVRGLRLLGAEVRVAPVPGGRALIAELGRYKATVRVSPDPVAGLARVQDGTWD